MLTIPAVSTEYVRIPVVATHNGIPVDPSADAVSIAFLATSATPTTSDWQTATWDTTGPGAYVAQILVGPTGILTLTPGTYYTWIKIVDGPEVVIRNPGFVVIT